MELFDSEKTLKRGLKMLTFTASWCGDCKFIKPFMPLIEQNYPEWDFIEVDITDHPEFAEKMQIKGIPSFVALNDGKEVGRFVNSKRKTKEEIENFIGGLNIK